jgi:hypothetical protein
MPTRRLAVKPKKRVDKMKLNKFVIIKKSSNYLGGPYSTEEAATKAAREELGESYSFRNEKDSVTIFKIEPVKRVVKLSSFTEEKVAK